MRNALFVICLILLSLPATAQPPAHHRVVIEVATVGWNGWALTIGNAETLQRAFGADGIEIEIVLHGPGIAMVHKSDVEFAARIQQLASRGVRFVACETSLKLGGTPAADLFPFVSVVDSGIVEVVKKQEAGWTYLKGGY
jgi:intracellular sulfur oxidation DsrE/DsrF family protein